MADVSVAVLAASKPIPPPSLSLFVLPWTFIPVSVTLEGSGPNTWNTCSPSPSIVVAPAPAPAPAPLIVMFSVIWSVPLLST